MTRVVIASRYEDTFNEIMELVARKEAAGSLTFFTMSNVKRLGINPLSGTRHRFIELGKQKEEIPPSASDFDTPVGIYCFPFNTEFATQAVNNNLPYAVDRKYINVFDIKQKLAQQASKARTIGKPHILLTSRGITKPKLSKYVDALRKLVPSFPGTDAELHAQSVECRNKTPIGLLWYYTMIAAEIKYVDIRKIAKWTWSIPVRIWTSIMRRLGIVAFIDDAERGIIHPNEPMQAVILDPVAAIDKTSWRYFRSPAGARGLLRKEKGTILPIQRESYIYGDVNYGDFTRKVASIIALETMPGGTLLKRIAENYWVAVDAKTGEQVFGWIAGFPVDVDTIDGLAHYRRSTVNKRFVFTAINEVCDTTSDSILFGPIKNGKRYDWHVSKLQGVVEKLAFKYNKLASKSRPSVINQKTVMDDVAVEITNIMWTAESLPDKFTGEFWSIGDCKYRINCGVIDGTVELSKIQRGLTVTAKFMDGFLVYADGSNKTHTEFHNGAFNKSTHEEKTEVGHMDAINIHTRFADGTLHTSTEVKKSVVMEKISKNLGSGFVIDEFAYYQNGPDKSIFLHDTTIVKKTFDEFGEQKEEKTTVRTVHDPDNNENTVEYPVEFVWAEPDMTEEPISYLLAYVRGWTKVGMDTSREAQYGRVEELFIEAMQSNLLRGNT